MFCSLKRWLAQRSVCKGAKVSPLCLPPNLKLAKKRFTEQLLKSNTGTLTLFSCFSLITAFKHCLICSHPSRYIAKMATEMWSSSPNSTFSRHRRCPLSALRLSALSLWTNLGKMVSVSTEIRNSRKRTVSEGNSLCLVHTDYSV